LVDRPLASTRLPCDFGFKDRVKMKTPLAMT